MSVTNIYNLLNPQIPYGSGQEIAHSNEDPTDTKTQAVAQIPIQNLSEKRVIKWIRWTPKEKSKLLKLVEEHGTEWSIISDKLHRTYNACRLMFQELTKQNPDCEPVKNQNWQVTSVKKEKWTPKEKLKLLRLVDADQEHDWPKIASSLNKTVSACQVMFSRLNKHREIEALKALGRKTNSLHSSDEQVLVIAQTTIQKQPVKKTIKKLRWSSNKKFKLIQLAHKYQNNWKKISPMLNKTPGACQAMFSRLTGEVALLSLKKAS